VRLPERSGKPLSNGVESRKLPLDWRPKLDADDAQGRFWAVTHFGWRPSRADIAGLQESSFTRPYIDAPAFAAHPSTDPKSDRPRHALSADHGYGSSPAAPCPRSLQDAEGSFISCQRRLPLKLRRQYSQRLAGDDVCRPEPDAERRMTARCRPGGRLGGDTHGTPQHRSGDNAEGLGDLAAMRLEPLGQRARPR
jgi:hypothetical protein